MTSLFIGRTHVAVAGGGEVAVGSPEGTVAGEQSAEHFVRAAWELMPTKKRRLLSPSVTVWLSAAWCRTFMVPAVEGLKSWQEVTAWAQAQWGAQRPQGWSGTPEIWLDSWSGKEDCLAVAVDSSMLNALRQHAAVTKWRLAAVRPWWSASSVLEAPQRSADEALFASCPDGTTWLVGNNRKVLAAGTWSPAPQGSSATAMRQRVLAMHPSSPARDEAWSPTWLD